MKIYKLTHSQVYQLQKKMFEYQIEHIAITEEGTLLIGYIDHQGDAKRDQVLPTETTTL